MSAHAGMAILFFVIMARSVSSMLVDGGALVAYCVNVERAVVTYDLEVGKSCGARGKREEPTGFSGCERGCGAKRAVAHNKKLSCEVSIIEIAPKCSA